MFRYSKYGDRSGLFLRTRNTSLPDRIHLLCHAVRSKFCEGMICDEVAMREQHTTPIDSLHVEPLIPVGNVCNSLSGIHSTYWIATLQ